MREGSANKPLDQRATLIIADHLTEFLPVDPNVTEQVAIIRLTISKKELREGYGHVYVSLYRGS